MVTSTLDRLKDVIVTGGENVYCGEVEAVIFGHSGGPRGGSFGIPDQHWEDWWTPQWS